MRACVYACAFVRVWACVCVCACASLCVRVTRESECPYVHLFSLAGFQLPGQFRSVKRQNAGKLFVGHRSYLLRCADVVSAFVDLLALFLFVDRLTPRLSGIVGDSGLARTLSRVPFSAKEV